MKQGIRLGNWLRQQTEHCILATRRRPTVRLSVQSTVLQPRARDHSRKPDEFYELVEGLCPGSKVELFARSARAGWAAHGDEVARPAKSAARSAPGAGGMGRASAGSLDKAVRALAADGRLPRRGSLVDLKA